MAKLALPNPGAIFDEILGSGAGLAGAGGVFRGLERLWRLKKSF